MNLVFSKVHASHFIMPTHEERNYAQLYTQSSAAELVT